MLSRRTTAKFLGRAAAIAIVALCSLLVRGDVFILNPAQEASSKYAFDLIGWHLTNSMSKWTHRALRAIPGQAISDSDRLALVDGYFRLGHVENDLKSRLNVATSQAAETISEAKRLQDELDRVHQLRHDIRNDVEETLESEISSVARAEGLGLVSEIVFPAGGRSPRRDAQGVDYPLRATG